MKFGIIGLPGSGKSTVFEALTQNVLEKEHRSENRIGTIRVPDKRVDGLNRMYKRKRTVFAHVEYLLPGLQSHGKDRGKEQNIWSQVRDCDALICVVRNFSGYGFDDPAPFNDFHELSQELILEDLVVAEKRLERIELEKKRHRLINQDEIELLQECRKHLESETPLRKIPDIASAHLLRGFAFLSAKPMLVLFNNEDEDDSLPEGEDPASKENCMIIRGKLEQELAQMPGEEVEAFLEEFNISASAMDRVIKQSYILLGLISFFTVGNDEVKAWTVKKETRAIDAAEMIHTDIKKGFIRAEVISYTDLMDAGSYSAARKKGTVRLEGKTYEVQDGDVIYFRFNV